MGAHKAVGALPGDEVRGRCHSMAQQAQLAMGVVPHPPNQGLAGEGLACRPLPRPQQQGGAPLVQDLWQAAL